ncbi:MAG: DNA helicase UvrD, partial [Gammaproteobacteria bacterium]|nr:DNA helicase UvrD [Gammaproteobacteria bacterium]
QGIVDWVNDSFATVLPEREDISSGAVSYTPATAWNAVGNNNSVSIHPYFSDAREEEAQQVLKLIEQAHADNAVHSVAVLVSSRTHLAEIVPLLRQKGRRFRAVEIEHLGNRPIVQDLLALTRALLQPADRTAWLAVLRAPWCGFTLDDLHRLAAVRPGENVPDLLRDERHLQTLTQDARDRLARILPVLISAVNNRRRRFVRDWVEGVWQAIGGPAGVAGAEDINDANAFFEFLGALEQSADIADINRIEDNLAELFARTDPGVGEDLQIMTIHKAKGLEFDAVILPGLGRRQRSDESSLLRWLERPREHGVDLLLASIRPVGSDADVIYDFLGALQTEKQLLEQGRLLYVAATRARKVLHLLGHVNLRESRGELSLTPPPKGSLLAQLWPLVKESFMDGFNKLKADGLTMPSPDSSLVRGKNQQLRRLPKDWRQPAPPDAVAVRRLEPETATTDSAVEYLWAGETAKHVGTVVHKFLQQIAEQGLDGWADARVTASRPLVQSRLRQLGVAESELAGAVDRVEQALLRTLADDDGKWVLGG